jgi:hypothetical protein
MRIREVLAALRRVQETVAITEPMEARIVRVYPYLPPGQDAIDVPCVINQWRFVSQALRPNSQRELKYVIRSQVFVVQTGVDFDRYSETAAALHDALIEAMASKLQLDRTVSLANVRGDEATYMPVIFDRGGDAYIGLQYQTDVTINDTVTVGG